MTNFKFNFDVANKESSPQWRKFEENSDKITDFEFEHFLPNSEGATSYNFTIVLSDEKKNEIEQYATIIKDTDNINVLFAWVADSFHYDVTEFEYKSLEEKYIDQNSNYVYFITDIGTQDFNKRIATQEEMSAINDAILLIKKVRNFIEGQS